MVVCSVVLCWRETWVRVMAGRGWWTRSPGHTTLSPGAAQSGLARPASPNRRMPYTPHKPIGQAPHQRARRHMLVLRLERRARLLRLVAS